MERPVPKDGNQACSQVFSLQKCMHTCLYRQGYCQRLVSIWIVIYVCNLEINLFAQDWKIFRHYWVMHCVLQHISNDWIVKHQTGLCIKMDRTAELIDGFLYGWAQQIVWNISKATVLYFTLKSEGTMYCMHYYANKSFKKSDAR